MNDLIKQLTDELKLAPETAETGTGAILGLLQEKIAAPDQKAVLALLPEASGWIEKAHTLSGAASASGSKPSHFLGSDPGTLPSAAGLTSVVTLLGKVGIDPATAGRFVPIVLNFLHGKLGKTEFDRIATAVPFVNEAMSGGMKKTAGQLLK